jgi:hypothetical protein
VAPADKRQRARIGGDLAVLVMAWMSRFSDIFSCGSVQLRLPRRPSSTTERGTGDYRSVALTAYHLLTQAIQFTTVSAQVTVANSHLLAGPSARQLVGNRQTRGDQLNGQGC